MNFHLAKGMASSLFAKLAKIYVWNRIKYFLGSWFILFMLKKDLFELLFELGLIFVIFWERRLLRKSLDGFI